jgi:hypothetical protein
MAYLIINLAHLHGAHIAKNLGASKNSINAMMARRKYAKKRSLHVVNEHFERISNAASAHSAIF